ncbi:murein transglycosylase [Cladophialophora psammophila CBS 110553]|uniref:Murein transglycosylase n=1 Tax=Cladophialophora psammophila CBS 110553 TaxID=1182543 RepID=W9VQG2_9EURO|nr:murein transglycosylase [Cladophialophora psammophila CBS 110553]EXJ57798.1 murein transglycosylase [Cladophialophora psammophila CBS 110553]
MSALLTTGLLAALAVSPVSAFWRLPCKSPIVVERADPIVNPGAVSGHLHTIMGGNGFDFTMDYNSTQRSTCSSCTVIGDYSNYWIPALFFQHQNGTFESVDQVGGATVYYLQRAGKGETLKAFPPGFRMIAGNPFKRTGGDDFATQAISYNCLDYNGPAKPETPNFPNYNCPNGLRSQVFFPSCWNGKDLDSPNHSSHVSYPANAYNNGPCPADFPVHLISIFFEIIWDTGKFADQWYGNEQPFVWSMGDPTGYGGHGDFVMGWDPDLLQSAVDQCTNDSGRVEDCPVFDLIPDSQAEGCRIEPQVDEQVSGLLTALPGCNPVQPGPTATPQSGCGATTTITPSNTTFFTDLTSKGWEYMGCGTDNYYNRILTGASQSNGQMTNENCVAFCESKGFSIAGSEYADECYCGNSIPDSGKPVPGVIGACTMKCAGDNSEFCGGAGTISLYQKCSGDSCKNAQFGPGSSAPVQVANPPPAASSSSAPAPPAAPSTTSSSGPYTAPSSPTTLATVTTTKAAAPTESSKSAPATTASVNTASTYLPPIDEDDGSGDDDDAYYTESGSVYPPVATSSAGGSVAADASSSPASTTATPASSTTSLRYLYTSTS